ncbi:Fic family protein [Xylanimonas protaetiae]|uniref:Fic family protein n=1 Tax=Xylanimonas protaetiae TaxID=2509457 RepID=A0A4P6F4M0_9MICO|nr:Fic family protein [Xylanimonas protaetiae]QAY70286.1 Fic family protein [Xylanimonas protaetiae]
MAVTTFLPSRPGRGRPSRDAVYRRFADAIDELANYGGLPKPHEAKKLWDDLWALEAHHSTAIEGNTLVLREVEKLLQEGRAVGAKEIKDYLEVLGYGDAATWVYRQAVQPDAWTHDGLVAVTEVRRIHATAMEKVWQVAPHPDATSAEGPGSFRQHEIMPFGGGMQPPTHPLVASELSAWVDEANAVGARVRAGLMPVSQVPEALAALHRRFEWIHPFIDGNGRTGRLVLNLLLVRLGWPPAVIMKDQRKRYLTALDRADNGDFGPLAEIIARCVVDSLHRLIPNIAGPAKYVPLEALTDTGLSLVALRQAATRGRLEAVIGPDGRYRSSRVAVEEYKASRYRRSPDAHA